MGCLQIDILNKVRNYGVLASVLFAGAISGCAFDPSAFLDGWKQAGDGSDGVEEGNAGAANGGAPK